jgi:hypothetical protein
VNGRAFRSEALGIAFAIDERFAQISPGCAPASSDVEHGAARPVDGASAGACDADRAAGAAQTGPADAPGLPTAHFLASEPAAGRIAALAVVTVASAPRPAAEWLAEQVARARASFATWLPASHEMLVAPEAATLATRPAIHVRYRMLTGDEGGGDGGAAEPVPPSLVEHWTVLVEERAWLLAFELMVQPPAWWDAEREALELPFRTLELRA